MPSQSKSNIGGDTLGSRFPLSAAFVRTIKRPGAYGDGRGGHGLILRVKPRKAGGVSKNWVQRLRIHGKPVNIGLGTYPLVSLAEARGEALVNRRAVAKGEDPRMIPAKVPTFAEAAEQLIALRELSWKNGPLEARIWRSSLRNYVFPSLGSKPVTEITAADLLAVLTPIWATKQESARRVRQRIGGVMRWCIAQGHRKDNPAGDAIGNVLPRHKGPRQHHPALAYTEVGKALRTVRASGAYKATILCFEFLVLCGVRSSEARHARWDEIDFGTKTWTIPGERMKSGRTHRVPLPTQAIAVLEKAAELRDRSGLLFPSLTGKALGNMTLAAMIRKLGIPAVPHGFRATLRVFASERTDAPRAVMEAALAHRLGDLAEQAYARSDLFEKRQKLMQDWANYIDST